MEVPVSISVVAREIALTLIEGFNKHYRLFRECSAQAKERFEEGNWQVVQHAVESRIQFYDQRV